MYYQWVVEIGLRVKDRELAQGLDRHGKPLRPVSARTRKHRRSAMTPDGRGDPSAPALMPARALSRTRSLLAGRATEDAAVFYWRFDPLSGDSWGKILAIHRRKGRDVIGLSDKGVARVRQLAWERWRAYKRGEPIAAGTASSTPAGIPQVGSYSTKYATFGINAQSPPKFLPGQSTGGMTWPEWRKYLRQPNEATVAPPGRAPGPHNRLLAQIWGTTGAPPAGPKAPPRAPRPPRPSSPATARPTAATEPIAPAEVRTVGDMVAYARSLGYRARSIDSAELGRKLRRTIEEARATTAIYNPGNRTIYINADSHVWTTAGQSPEEVLREQGTWHAVHTVAGIVDHEIGHARHHAAIGTDRFLAARADTGWLGDPDSPEGFAEHTRIWRLVSGYATRTPLEFVAEVYAGLAGGRKYPREILDLFRQLGGVTP